jgi:hypothetical protein
LDTEEKRQFPKALQNLGRYASTVDEEGNPIDLMAAAPFGTDRVKPVSPFFIVIIGLLFARVMVKIPRLDHIMESIYREKGKHKLDKLFDLKTIDAEGHEVHLIGPLADSLPLWTSSLAPLSGPNFHY